MDLIAAFNPGRVPTRRTLPGRDERLYGIVHFGPNTFSDQEWGYGDVAPECFAPAQFDAGQIVRAARAGGLAGVILVCKHHDGFCLWPTETTAYQVGNSPWRDGNGDMVREFADACRREKMRFGVYVSPWDRNHPEYGNATYVEVFRRQLRELLTNYAPIFEVWFDGANGGDGYYGGARESRQIDRSTYYEWEKTWEMVRELAPDAAIFSDVGPDRRWAGNEEGFVEEECFGSITPRGVDGAPGPGCTDYSQNPAGQFDGKYYIPPECDVPLRPGWFFHASENEHLRSCNKLVELYLRSIGNGGFLNLGLAPDRRGVLHENDVRRLKEFGQARQSLFADRVAEGSFPAGGGRVSLRQHTQFNLIELAETLAAGEKVHGYTLWGLAGEERRKIFSGKAIGALRIRLLEEMVTAESLLLELDDSESEVEFRLYRSEWQKQSEEGPDLRNRPDYQQIACACRGCGEIAFHFGEVRKLHGFIFTPEPDAPQRAPRRYRLLIQADEKSPWYCVASGEFGNLLANPIPQVVEFPPCEAGGIRFCADDRSDFDCGAFGVLLVR